MMTGHGFFVYLVVQFRLQCSFVMTTAWEEPEVSGFKTGSTSIAGFKIQL